MTKLIVETKHSRYRVEIGEGSEVEFSRIKGNPGTYASNFAQGGPYRGRLAAPLVVGNEMRILRELNRWQNEWNDLRSDDNEILTTAVLLISEE